MGKVARELELKKGDLVGFSITCVSKFDCTSVNELKLTAPAPLLVHSLKLSLPGSLNLKLLPLSSLTFVGLQVFSGNEAATELRHFAVHVPPGCSSGTRATVSYNLEKVPLALIAQRER